ncbi:unnamed protein product, partial [Candidula unifasciata]
LSGILPSYLHTGPPVLLNPERVIPYSESERYERHFTPNVSLAPSFSQKGSPDDEIEDTDVKAVPSSVMSADECFSSETPVRKPLPGISKFEADHRETIEYDIATDTDDSSMASPTESCRDTHLSDLPIYESTLEQEMDMIRTVLEGKVDPAPEAQTRFLQDYSKMRAKTEETVQWLLREIGTLKNELEAVRRQNLELGELVSKSELERRNLTLEKEYALKEVTSQKQQSQIHNKIDMELEKQLRSMESLYQEAYSENRALRLELASMSEKSKSSKYSNGVGKTVKSPCLRMTLGTSPSREAGTTSQKQPLSLEIKRERDITVD